MRRRRIDLETEEARAHWAKLYPPARNAMFCGRVSLPGGGLDPLICTRPAGHDEGPHVAHAGDDRAVAHWR